MKAIVLLVLSIYVLFLVSCMGPGSYPSTENTNETIIEERLQDIITAEEDDLETTASWRQNRYEETEWPETEAEIIELTEEEAICSSTHIVIAEFISEGKYYQFHVQEVLKANSEIEDTIHTVPYPDTKKLISGQSYLLFLERNRQVFYEFDKYTQLTGYELIDSEERKAEIIEKVQALADQNTAPAYFGNSYTLSADLNDILDESYHIVTVKVLDDGIPGEYHRTIFCRCNVTDTFKGEITRNEDIYVTFFMDDQVQTGQEYMVFLSECKEGAPIYTLSSRNSVYSVEEGKQILAKYGVSK